MSDKYQQQSNGCGCLLALISFGLLIAISLPSCLNCSNKAKQAEGKASVGSMNRGQQAYFLENNTFSNDIQKLGIGMKTETTNYRYSTYATKKAVFNYGVARPNNYRTEYILFIPIKKGLNSYIGGVFIVPATQLDAKAAKDEMTTIAILCETNSPSKTKPPQPTYKDGKLACGKGTTDLNRDR